MNSVTWTQGLTITILSLLTFQTSMVSVLKSWTHKFQPPMIWYTCGRFNTNEKNEGLNTQV